jgi:adenosylhomocysteinase
MAEAAARGFPVFRRLDEALFTAGLVVSATGNHALGKNALAALRSGTVVATVTSADDEFAKDKPLSGWISSAVDGGPLTGEEDIVRYDNDTGKYFWLINDGRPANFVHGAVIGPAIQLIEGEKLMLVKRLTERAFPGPTSSVAELNTSDREVVARIWNEHFLPD